VLTVNRPGDFESLHRADSLDRKVSMAYDVQELTFDSLAAAPLTFDYWLVPPIDFRTTVTGANRDTANIQVFYVTTPLGSTTLTQLQPTQNLPEMQGGSYLITDASVTMTVPSPTTPGNVMLSCTVTVTGQKPVKASLPIASWPLKSANGG
jgi:hypothetical protein